MWCAASPVLCEADKPKFATAALFTWNLEFPCYPHAMRQQPVASSEFPQPEEENILLTGCKDMPHDTLTKLAGMVKGGKCRSQLTTSKV